MTGTDRYITEGMARDEMGITVNGPDFPEGFDVYEEIQRLKKELHG